MSIVNITIISEPNRVFGPNRKQQSEPNLSFFQKTEQNRTEIRKSTPHIPAKLATRQLFTAR